MIRLTEITEDNWLEAAAIGLYEKYGFVDSGYIDEDAPDSLNMICCFTEGGAK